MKQKNKRLEKGITLIALVITIIVLLILAGVTIRMLTGDNGILKQATNAKNTTDKSEFEEQVKLAIMASKVNDTGNLNLTTLEKEINKISGTTISKSTNDDLPWTVKKDKYEFVINQTETTVDENIITIDTNYIKTHNPKEYYGKEVLNYKSEDDEHIYRIFYVSTKDNEFDNSDPQYTIYLKADDSYSNENKKYDLWNYSKYDTTNTKVRSMNPLWAKERGNDESGWQINEKESAYLCSPVTSDVGSTLPWNSYYYPDKANYVIGSPSIEIYAKSFNQTHDKDDNGNEVLGYQYQTSSVIGYGYKMYGEIKNNGLYMGCPISAGSEIYDYMYYGKNESKLWWLASPSAAYDDCSGLVDSNGKGLGFSFANHKDSYGISPIISLKSSFKPQVEK